MQSALLLVLFWTATSSALQFLRTNQTNGHFYYAGLDLGMDFTVYRAITVSAVGVIDADERGLNGTLTVQIVDRSHDGVLLGPISFNSSDRRADDANPFAFKNVALTRLLPGAYCIMSTGFRYDKIISTHAPNGTGSVVRGDDGDGAVVITAGGERGNGLLSSTLQTTAGSFFAGATFRFDVVPSVPAPPLSQPTPFADCEAVACAGLESGWYSIGGQRRFCDNDMAGGGWMRLWRANDSTCEQNGWTSARNPSLLNTVDPFGCRSGAQVCLYANTSTAPFAFKEVRGGNWLVWGFGSLDAFYAPFIQGVVVRSNSSSGAIVWALAIGLPHGGLPTECPCEGEYSWEADQLLQTTGPHWTCSRVLSDPASRFWTKMFHAGANNASTFMCTGKPSAQPADLVWFQRTLSAPATTLAIGNCHDQGGGDEDLKLAEGDLFVRATVGFDKAVCLATRTTAATAATKMLSTVDSLASSPQASSSLTNAINSTNATSTTTAAQVDLDSSSSSGSSEAWIVPTIVVIGVLCAIALIGGIVVSIVRGKNKQAATITTDALFVSAREQPSVDSDRPGYVQHARDFVIAPKPGGHYEAFTAGADVPGYNLPQSIGIGTGAPSPNPYDLIPSESSRPW